MCVTTSQFISSFPHAKILKNIGATFTYVIIIILYNILRTGIRVLSNIYILVSVL